MVDGLTFGHHAHDTVAVVAAIGALYGGGEGSSLHHECGTLGHTPETWHSEARKKTQISEILGITALNFQTT